MDKLENKTIKILYGSETGNAQEFAEQIWKKCRKTIPVECLAIDDYPIHNLCEESTAIFIVSTSGQGEVPTNMRKNWTFLLSKKLPEKCWLSKTKIAVLGLGDSSYQKYNYAGKKIFRRLVQLGAQPILQLSLADDQHRLGIDEMFEKWQSELMETEPFKSFESDKNKIFSNIGGGQSSKFYPLELVENERLTAENHFQETRLITFSLENVKDSSNFRYSPGDVLMVLPENLEGTIEIARNSLKSCEQYFNSPISSACQLDQFIARVPQFLRIKASPEPTFIECLQFYFDLQCIPKRNFVKEMADRAADGIEKERLVELSSSEGIDDYLDYCVHSRRTTAEFLRDFPETSANLIPSDLFAFFPAIRPRGFSIASSPNAHSDRIQILVARVEYAVRKMKASRLGLCSNFLCTAKPSIKVFLRIRPGIFQHANSEEPLILVGPGTGVAPFRSFISQNELASSGCKILLFFGCRGQYRDFYFRDEWSRCSKAQIVTAFSRDQEKKVYVQHKIVRNGKQIWELLNQGGRIFIAGASGDMPKQVVAALKNVLIGFGGISLDEADKQIELMEKKKRLQYETWC